MASLLIVFRCASLLLVILTWAADRHATRAVLRAPQQSLDDGSVSIVGPVTLLASLATLERLALRADAGLGQERWSVRPIGIAASDQASSGLNRAAVSLR
ncbi:MAG: hypothetical protein WBG92_21055 [Thiohalocapsa sp.]